MGRGRVQVAAGASRPVGFPAAGRGPPTACLRLLPALLQTAVQAGEAAGRPGSHHAESSADFDPHENCGAHGAPACPPAAPRPHPRRPQHIQARRPPQPEHSRPQLPCCCAPGAPSPRHGRPHRPGRAAAPAGRLPGKVPGLGAAHRRRRRGAARRPPEPPARVPGCARCLAAAGLRLVQPLHALHQGEAMHAC